MNSPVISKASLFQETGPLRTDDQLTLPGVNAQGFLNLRHNLLKQVFTNLSRGVNICKDICFACINLLLTSDKSEQDTVTLTIKESVNCPDFDKREGAGISLR